MKKVTRSVRFVLSMVLVMAMVLTSIGSLGTVAKAETGRAADGLKGIYRIYHTEDATQRMAPGADQASEGNTLWLWEQGSTAPADCEMFYFEQAEDGSYYWYNKQDAELVMQASEKEYRICKPEMDDRKGRRNRRSVLSEKRFPLRKYFCKPPCTGKYV